MEAGTLNKRITIQYATKVGDDMGGFIVSWVDAVTVWAALWPLSATESVKSMQTGMVVSHRVRIRYLSVLRPSWRLKFGEKFYNIVSIINPSMKNEYLDILVKEAT